MPKFLPFPLLKCLMVLVSFGVFVFLVLRVGDKANPWERVLVIDSGLEEDESRGSTLNRRAVCCFSEDESKLFVAMPNGLIDAWDIGKLQKLNSFGVPLNNDVKRHDSPHLGGAWNLDVNDVGELVESRWGRLLKHSENGELIDEYPMDEFYGKYFVSPDGKWAASNRVASGPKLINLDTKEKRSLEPQQGLNASMDARFQWTEDGEGLLFSELLACSLTDLQSGKTKFVHRELNLDLPYPHFPTEALEESVRRESGAMLVDSQLVDGDSKVVSIYGKLDWGGVDPNKFILRFYHAEDGKVLKSKQLPYEPRSLWASEDGSLVYITMCPDFNTVLMVYDAKSMEQLAVMQSKMTSTYPTRVIGLPNEKSVVHFNAGSYMQHWEDEYAPFRLDNLREDVIQVISNSQADLLVTALNSRDVHVWKKRREPSRWGAFAVWEYGASYLWLSIMMIVFVGWLCANTEQAKGRSFTRLERMIILFSAFLLAISIAGLVYKPVLGDLWVLRPEGITFFKVLGCVLSLASIIGLARQHDGWRKFVRFMSFSGGFILLGLIIYFGIRSTQLEIAWDTIASQKRVDGLKLDLSLSSSVVVVLLFSCFLFFKCWVLRRSFHEREEKEE